MHFFKHHEAKKDQSQVYGDGADDSSGFGANDYQGYRQREHKSSFTYEAIADTAAAAAIRAYEDRVRNSGEPVSHPRMKEMLAEFAAAEVERIFETNGIDYLDREKAKRMAIHQAHKMANDKYGPGQVYQGNDFGNYQQQNYDQGTGYQQAGDNSYQSRGERQNDYNQSYGRDDNDNYQQNRGYNDSYQQNQGYNDSYQQNRGDNYDQSGGGDYSIYNNQGPQQQQQWGGGDDRPMPEHRHHHHHRREEDDY